MTLRTSRDIECSLERFSAGHNCCDLLNIVWRHYEVSVTVFQFLDPTAQYRLAKAHIVILIDRSEVALSATARSLGLDSILSSFSVPTPPLQVWSIPGSSHGGESTISTGSEAEMGELTGLG